MVDATDDEKIVEEGDIVFLYRPKTGEDDPSGIGDVQRFEMALRPKGGKVRLCVVGRKRLPDVEKHETNWGFVDMIGSEKEVEKALREETQQTKTRGETRYPAARPVGEGVYAITLEDGALHLTYALEAPGKPGEPQKALNIPGEASFILSVKNPEKGQPKTAGLDPERKADYPRKLQELFRGRRFDREHVELLDREGAEFMLVGGRLDPEEEYGLDLDAGKESYDSSDAVKRLRLVKSRHPVTPLFEGEWD